MFGLVDIFQSTSCFEAGEFGHTWSPASAFYFHRRHGSRLDLRNFNPWAVNAGSFLAGLRTDYSKSPVGLLDSCSQAHSCYFVLACYFHALGLKHCLGSKWTALWLARMISTAVPFSDCCLLFFLSTEWKASSLLDALLVPRWLNFL